MRFVRTFSVLLLSGVVLLFVGIGAALWGAHHYSRGLPPHEQLLDYYPATLTRVHAGDGRLLAEFARERRVFVPIASMPEDVVNAFLSAEDKRFYDHPGIDLIGVARALVQNLRNFGSGQRLVGASTITQQVAKNFLLTNEIRLERKIREALLALRIEQVLSKERILELYLNEIFLGQRAYGVAAAALNYFDRSLDELSLAEAAFLAGLPKAPNNYHPHRAPEAARKRRDYVLGRMLADGHITADQAANAMAGPVQLRGRDRTRTTHADYFAEEVRRELEARHGERALYRGGLSVRTTLDPHYQAIARRSLREGLITYDRRHGWRGPLEHWQHTDAWQRRLAALSAPVDVEPWQLAVVLSVEHDAAEIGVVDGTVGVIPFREIGWARRWRENQEVGPAPGQTGDVLSPGDVVLVEPLAGEARDADPEVVEGFASSAYALRQLPDVQGAIVALDPHTGRVLAMVGGWGFGDSQFNRATQARRQPGSAFKPFVYLAAVEQGLTPADIVLDAPIVIDQGDGLEKWKPKNHTDLFYGPSTLRLGIEKSRNLMTVRLASKIGMDRVVDVGRRFGIGDFPEVLSMALGAGETTLLRLAAAYGMLVNGGRWIEPAFIERIQDRFGRTVYRRDRRPCERCEGAGASPDIPPRLADDRRRVTDPASAFQISWMLKGVVDRGTGRRIAAVNRALAGKTGTTNESMDAWFIGFSPDLVVGVFIGFDTPRSLGPRQTGANVAAPVFKSFMAEALADRPEVPFRIPPRVRMVRIDADTGLLPSPDTERLLIEAFKPGTEPVSSRPVNQLSRSDGTAGAGSTRDTAIFDTSLY